MSLLMDALRKAEQQKQKLEERPSLLSSGVQGGLILEPIPRQVPSVQSPAELNEADSYAVPGLPELPNSLEALDEQFMAHAGSNSSNTSIWSNTPGPAKPPTSSTPPTPDQPKTPPPSRDAVRTMFEAKQALINGNRKLAITVGMFGLIVAFGIGGYLWWQLQPHDNNHPISFLPISPPSQSPSLPTEPITQAAPAAAPILPLPPAPAVTIPGPAVLPAPTFSASAPIKYAEVHSEDQQTLASQPAVKNSPVSQPTSITTARAPQSSIQQIVSIPKPDTNLLQAHEAFNRGEFDLARTTWLKVLAADPHNRHALQGMAIISQQKQEVAEAAHYYQRALEINPKDDLALAGLLALKAPGNSLHAESYLKILLAEQPESTYLNFALGNQLARQHRWPEAQQAYFKAYSTEPSNPIYALNLAVSLDHLHKTQLAIKYYKEALTIAEKQPGQSTGFNRTTVTDRLKQLQSDSDSSP